VRRDSAASEAPIASRRRLPQERRERRDHSPDEGADDEQSDETQYDCRPQPPSCPWAGCWIAYRKAWSDPARTRGQISSYGAVPNHGAVRRDGRR
jgi:hypothetical protein